MADTALLSGAEHEKPVADLPWWKGAVIYQIYPRSFLDTCDDGIGDLNGIYEGLDHIASLGVDGIWISPFFTSPMADYGYDVADFCDVDPIFGTLEDFDRVVEKAHSLGLKVIIDQVYSHTSDQHAWFKESRASAAGDKADWYVWAPPKPDGTPPNNWQSVFGGSSWEWDARRSEYYLHNFLKEQPDLNVHNPDVQDALIAAGKFWLDRGVDGFRLDALNFSMHNRSLKDNPPSGVSAKEATRSHDMQLHINNMSQPEIVDFIERFKTMLEEYPGTFTVAEVGGPDPIGEMQAFTHGEKRLNSAYSFDFLYAPELTPERIMQSAGQWTQAADEGWPSWAFSNHDAPRAITRWASEEHHDEMVRVHMMLLLGLRGNPIVYQGEELGLGQGHVAYEHLKDPEAIMNWPKTLGRDGARTPFPWRRDQLNAGFSSATPWLPIDPQHAARAVDAQGSEDSMLNFTRKALTVRKQQPALMSGSMDMIPTDNASLLRFVRRSGDQNVLAVFNFGDAEFVLPKTRQSTGQVLLSSRPLSSDFSETFALPARTSVWMELDSATNETQRAQRES